MTDLLLALDSAVTSGRDPTLELLAVADSLEENCAPWFVWFAEAGKVPRINPSHWHEAGLFAWWHTTGDDRHELRELKAMLPRGNPQDTFGVWHYRERPSDCYLAAARELERQGVSLTGVRT